MYNYKAKLIRIIDGDTVVLNVDLGFHLWREDSFRLFGTNSPEMRGDSHDAGMAAREFLGTLIQPGCDVTISTFKQPDKYGRYLANITTDDGLNINRAMIAAGHAVPYTP